MSTELYENSGELLTWAQEAALAPRGGLHTTFQENGRYHWPLSLMSVILQPQTSQWEVLLIIIAIICYCLLFAGDGAWDFIYAVLDPANSVLLSPI